MTIYFDQQVSKFNYGERTGNFTEKSEDHQNSVVCLGNDTSHFDMETGSSSHNENGLQITGRMVIHTTINTLSRKLGFSKCLGFALQILLGGVRIHQDSNVPLDVFRGEKILLIPFSIQIWN